MSVFTSWLFTFKFVRVVFTGHIGNVNNMQTSEWVIKHTVKAKGSPDVPLNQIVAK